MAPEWTKAVRPLALSFTAAAFAIMVIFRADAEAQAGAYATGVLVLMSSAAVAVTLSTRRRGRRSATLAFGLITLAFAYTTIANIFERPEGIKITSFFIAAILMATWYDEPQSRRGSPRRWMSMTVRSIRLTRS